MILNIYIFIHITSFKFKKKSFTFMPKETLAIFNKNSQLKGASYTFSEVHLLETCKFGIISEEI